MVAECIIREDTDSLLGLSLTDLSDGNLTTMAGQCYKVSYPASCIVIKIQLFMLAIDIYFSILSISAMVIGF